MNISEYVTTGHPDKTADYISEYILDRLIGQDPRTRYALEVQIKDNFVTLGGEVTTAAKTDYDKWVRQAVAEIGYTAEYAAEWGEGNALNADKLIVEKHISQQSPDIAQGVDTDAWGDQGIMFGMATDDPETDNMPDDYYYAKEIGQVLYRAALNSGLCGLDIKTQVVTDSGQVVKVIAAAPMLTDRTDEVKKLITGTLMFGGKPARAAKDMEIIVNGTGKYVRHSSMGDCGTTGRKLAVDFYGGNCNIGGGSPWTKDGTKADLTLNMYARYLALKFVREFKMPYCKTGIGCCIGSPVVDITVWNDKNETVYETTEEVRPSGLIKRFGLDRPVFAKLCRDGLFSGIK